MASVLIIEDEPTIAMVLSEALSDEGYETVTEPDGAAGLQRLREGPLPNVVLLDLFMPGLSGRAVLEAMRSDPHLAVIPVILVTGAVPRTEDFPPETTYQALLSKPFSLEDLVASVRRCLEGQAGDAERTARG